MQKYWDWKLLSKIDRQEREISSFMWNYFSKIRLALFGQFDPRFVLEKYCCTTEKAISVSTSHVHHLFLGAKTRQGSEPPAGPPKFKQVSTYACAAPKSGAFPKPWPQSFSGCRIFLDLSLSESETTCKNLEIGSFSSKSDLRIARYLYFCEKKSGKCATPFEHDLPAAVL